MKNILLPTDLTVQSLSPLHQVMKDAKGEKVILQVVHLLSLPTSITDLLFLKNNTPYSSVPDTFIEAFQMLRHKYEASIEKIEFKFIYGNTSRYLNNYIEGNNVQAVYLLNNYEYQQPLKDSEDFKKLLTKCRVPVHAIAIQEEALSAHQTLSSLLTYNDPQSVNNSGKKTIKTAISYS